MAKYYQPHKNRVILNLAIVAFLALGAAVAVGLTTSKNSVLNFSGAQSFGPVDITPCSGHWTVTDCFNVKNTSTTDIGLKYHLDCWDETKCKDEDNIITLKAGATATLGLGHPCSKWQLDLNWTGKDGWDWGGVVEIPSSCGTGTPTPTSTPSPACDFVDINVTQ